MYDNIPICYKTLEQLMPDSLMSNLCVSIPKHTELWVGVGMLIHYLESFTDGLVVRDGYKPIGILAGGDVIKLLPDNANYEFFETTPVEEVMDENVVIVSSNTTLKFLLDSWVKSRKAIALVANPMWDYSALSAKKLIEIGTHCRTGIMTSDISQKHIQTFAHDDTVLDVINRMLENKTRKLVLEGTTDFVNDRMILEKVSEDFHHLEGITNFLQMPASIFHLEKSIVLQEDLNFQELSKKMNHVAHPYIFFKDQVISPWDICTTLLSKKITEYDIS